MMHESFVTHMDSPVGVLQIATNGRAITQIHFTSKEGSGDLASDQHPLLEEATQQLKEYFAGNRKHFDFAIQQQGTAFQQRVWSELHLIPFGTTTSYLQLARNLGDEKCIRAAASANGKNNLAIVVPCHRVIGSNGSLTGYAGGLWRKEWLLRHEGVLKIQPTQAKLFS